HKRIILKQGGDNGLYINGNNFSYSPGDTLVLSGTWSYCTLEDFYGTPNNYVIVINQGGQVTLSSGFSFTNCRFLKLLGTGSSDKYGFRISQTVNDGVGITVTGRSSHIDISNVDIYNKTYGYWVKQEASCIDSLQFPNWVINNISIHDGRIKKTNQEGLYLGSTDPNGLRALICSGLTIFPKPLRLGNIKVYNMIIDSTYRSGIQLSCASQGNNEIYNNTISNCGYEYVSNGQGSGISLGGYTQANLHDNTITNTYTMGISSLGAGPLTIKNNIVKNSGMLSGHTVPGMASIMVDTRNTNPADSTTFTIQDNTLGTNTDVNIRVYRTYPTYTKNNTVCSNGASCKIAIDPSIKYTSCQ
ncbi:MAG: right-handed parallel beta-helix repeat-containing protein, partial [Parafilimonas sp.]|nr:right-handed parallel beta-helix repeat-containing protein [Parafilimonas sp.]